MSKYYSFFFNGQEYCTESSISLSDLIEYFNFNSSLFILEYNKFICNKKEWRKIKIKENDTIEIVTIVGGG